MYDINDFLEQYRTLEDWANARYGADGIKTMEEVHPIGRVRNDVKFFRSVRNVLTHNPKGCKPLIELTDEFKERFTSLCSKLMSSASQISVQEKDIFKRTVGDKVMPTIAYMKEKAYSYVPIVNGKKVWGVFSESALFNIIGDGKMEYIKDDVQFLNIANYISEYSSNGVFDFVGIDESIDDIRRRFSEATDSGRHLQVLYITKTGDKNGDLVGLITVWDVANL